MSKTVLVTGGVRGIGRAVVECLARQGHRLAISFRSDEEAARAMALGLTAQGVEHALFKSDLADPDDAGSLPGRVVAKFGGLDALVNNAGIVDDAAFMTMERTRYAQVLKTNLAGTVRLTGAALPYLLAAKTSAIVMVSSLGGIAGKEGQVAYAASKGGLIGFTQWLGRRYGGMGLQVNAIAPGFIRTDMVAGLEPKMMDHIVDASSLRRLGTPEEVAAVVAFLLSPGYIQSTTIRVDGGFHR